MATAAVPVETNVLVVDDDPDDFVIIQSLLKEIGGYETSWASDISSGLEEINKGDFDAVLVDQRLGAESGLDLIEKAGESADSPPMILVTGIDDSVTDRTAVALGASDYLVKTQLTPETLDRSIRYAVGRRQARLELMASESRFRAMFHNAPVGIALHAIDGRYLATNSRYDQMFGSSSEGFTLADLVKMILPESKETLLQAFEQIVSRESETVTVDGGFTSASGQVVWAVLTTTYLPQPGNKPDQILAQVTDVTELKETQEKLEELLATKNQFLAAVSHELRTPLTAVIGLAELLRDPENDLDPEQRSSLINTIVESGFDVSNMVEDLLTAARQEAGQLTVVAVPVNLMAQTRQALEALDPDSEIAVTGESPQATADPGRVRQVLRNLLTNAVKYGGDDIRVALDQVGDFARAVVSDNGPGVPAEAEETIFKSYERAHAKESHPGSVGIGLSISRELARQMGGDLVYRRSGDRTRFELTVPVSPAEAQTADSTNSASAT